MEICSPDVASFANLAIKTFYNLWLCKGAVDWKMGKIAWLGHYHGNTLTSIQLVTTEDPAINYNGQKRI